MAQRGLGRAFMKGGKYNGRTKDRKAQQGRRGGVGSLPEKDKKGIDTFIIIGDQKEIK